MIVTDSGGWVTCKRNKGYQNGATWCTWSSTSEPQLVNKSPRDSCVSCHNTSALEDRSSPLKRRASRQCCQWKFIYRVFRIYFELHGFWSMKNCCCQMTPSNSASITLQTEGEDKTGKKKFRDLFFTRVKYIYSFYKCDAGASGDRKRRCSFYFLVNILCQNVQTRQWI